MMTKHRIRLASAGWLLLGLSVLAAGTSGLPIQEEVPPGGSLSKATVDWLQRCRTVLIATARLYGVDPLSAATVVAVELENRSLLDDLEDDYVRRLLEDKDEGFFRRLREAFANPAREFAGVSALDRMLHTCSLGPGQIQTRVALELERQVSAKRGRRPASLRMIFRALLDERLCLDYVCMFLQNTVRAYRELAGTDISKQTGVLATVYNIGSPEIRARHFKKEQLAGAGPELNEMGRRAEALTGEVRLILWPDNETR